MDQINKIKKLITLCNKYRDAYYNHQPLVPDDVYDRYFDELSRLEQETNCYFSNSPTQKREAKSPALCPPIPSATM